VKIFYQMSLFFDHAIEISPSAAEHVTIEFNSDGTLIIWTSRPIFARVLSRDRMRQDSTINHLNLANVATPSWFSERSAKADDSCFLCDHAEICAMHEMKKIPIPISSDEESETKSEMSEILKL
jgi:hypothetical protein